LCNVVFFNNSLPIKSFYIKKTAGANGDEDSDNSDQEFYLCLYEHSNNGSSANDSRIKNFSSVQALTF